MQLYVMCPLLLSSRSSTETDQVTYGVTAIEVEPSHTVRELKNQIHTMGGLAPEQQRLTFLREVLEDDRKLSSYKLGQNSLVEDSSAWLAVRIVGTKTILLSINPNDTLDSVKAKINEKEGIPVEHQLLLDAGVQAHKTLAEYKGNRLYLNVPCATGSLTVYIKTLASSNIRLDVEPSFSAEDIKFLICKETGLPMDNQPLLFGSNLLASFRSLHSYGVQDQSTLMLLPMARGIGRGMVIFVKFQTGRVITIDVKDNDSVAVAKSRIEEKTGVPPHHQCLMFAGTQLEEDKELSFYNIQRESTLQLFEDQCVPIELRASAITDRNTKPLINPHCMVYTLKCLIHKTRGLTKDQQILFYNGTELWDEQLLKDYNITDGSIVQIVSQNVQEYTVYLYLTGAELSSLVLSSFTTVYALTRLYPHQDFIFNGRRLKVGCCLDDYNVRPGDLIHCLPQDGSTPISVMSPNNSKLGEWKFDYHKEKETVLSLKARIWADVPHVSLPSQQRLTIRDFVMEDSLTLNECGVKWHEYIPVILSSPQQLFIRHLDSSTIEVHIHFTEKVSTLKRLIQSKVAIESSKQQLYYNGRVMNDRSTINSLVPVASPMLHLYESQCIHGPLKRRISSTERRVLWEQQGVEVTVQPGVTLECIVELRVHDSLSTTCFELSHEYQPLSNVYEISLSSSEDPKPGSAKVILSNFRQPRGGASLRVMVASRDPSKWTPNFNPIFTFSEVEGLKTQAGTRKVELVLKVSGVYLFIAAHLPLSRDTIQHVLQTESIPKLVEPVNDPQPNIPVPIPRQRAPHGQQVPQVSSPEHLTMVQCTPQLTDTLTADPLRVSEGLFSAFLTPLAIHDMVLHGAMTPREKASRLVASMTDRVSASPSDFPKFVSVLREQGSWTDHIVNVLETTVAKVRLTFPQQ